MTQNVPIAEAQGRPMLHWVGKRPLEHVTTYPAQLIERFDPLGPAQTSEVFKTSEVSDNLLFHGDNKDVLAWLLAHGYRGKVNLIYIDPPFDSGADYVRRVQLRGVRGKAKLEGGAHSLDEQIQYTDIWANDTYLQFMYERLLLLKELLTENGSIYVHCDWHRNHFLRFILDEVFGSEFLISEIVWKRATAKSNVLRKFPSIHDTVLLYVKDNKDYYWNQQHIEYTQEYIDQFYCYAESPATGEIIILKPEEKAPSGWRRFGSDNIVNPGYRPNLVYPYKGYPPPDNGWKFQKSVMERLDAEERLIFPSSPTGRIRLKKYLDEMPGKIVQDIWDDSQVGQITPGERHDYPTQKPEGLVERIIKTSSRPGDLLLDCFVGSGTTSAVAQKLGRRWIASDINKGAIQTTSKRLQSIIREQIKTSEVLKTSEVYPAAKQLTFQSLKAAPQGKDAAVPPAALSFSVYRVNDYDLQIQHNEAVNLAVEMIGIERIKTDPFFDGALGKRLVKITPFNHPLTPLDLQLVKDELKTRPDEERDVVIVCLGTEIAAVAWLEEYNQHRPINKIEVIELRTDLKYGKFFLHQPAQAQVRVERQGKHIVVEVEDFISPTIVERLEIDTPLFKVKIPDWRAMVDIIMIDAAYDGAVFNIALSDVPERKDDLVIGRYQLAAPEGATTIAVKIIDMLGEEVLVTAEV